MKRRIAAFLMILVLLMIDSPLALANKTGETGEALAGKEALPVEAAAPASADAESGEPEIHHCDDYDYVILKDGTAEITGYSGYADYLTIPSQLDDRPVTSIGDGVFQYDPYLTSMTIPSSVTSIVGNPFKYCEYLTSIIVPSDHPVLETIDEVLFTKTDKRLIWCPYSFEEETYTIPKGTRIIGDYAFYDCYMVKSISIPNSVTSIGDEAFCGCDSLRFISIPDNVISIGDYTFCGCESLTAISIPDNVTSIGDYAFSGCDSLRFISIPDNVTSIGDYAFSYCDSLTSITIPDSVTTIGDNAFAECDSLQLTVGRNSYAEEYCKENALYIYSDCDRQDVIKAMEVNPVERQILDTLNQYIAQNPGYQLNEKALEEIHAGAKSYDRLVNDLHALMKTEITPEKGCVVQFTTEQGHLIATYTFFNAIISEAA